MSIDRSGFLNENDTPRLSLKNTCSLWLSQLFPITTWLPQYKTHYLINDFASGLTVALMTIPQGLAYARVADLPIQYGLYGSFLAVIIYCFFGTSKDITLGPATITAMLVGQAVYNYANVQERIAIAVGLSFVTGAIQIIMGFFKLGIIVNYLSRPVISGFLCAAAILISAGQLGHIVGTEGGGDEIISVIRLTFSDLPDGLRAHWPDFILGVSTMLFLLLLQILGKKYRKIKVLWILGISRNFLVIFLAAILSFTFHKTGVHFNGSAETCKNDANYPCSPFVLIGFIPGGIADAVRVPVLNFKLIQDMGINIVLITLISYLDSISIAKGFSRKNGYIIEPNQELIALGASNFFSAFVSSYPVTASFSRCAVLSSTGVKTPLAGIVTSVFVIISILFLTDAFYWIPESALAGMIIISTIQMFDYEIILRLFRTKSLELIVFLSSFLGCLFLQVQYGIAVGIIVSFMMNLYKNTREGGLKLEYYNENMVAWSYKGPIFFLMSNDFAEDIAEKSSRITVPHVILSLEHVSYIDDSGLSALDDTLDLLRKRNLIFHLACVPEGVLEYLEVSGFTTRLGKENIHTTIPDDPRTSFFTVQCP
jgi:high affinity sulfate transporter 1